jgi:glycosyltransferase involved in cell wall biosynthesis
MAGPVAKTDVPHWLQDGDIFINTTNADNTPVSVLEALACGLCVVTTNVGGIPYLVADDQQALLVPPDDSTAMAAAVRQLLTTPELAARLSGEGHAYVQQFDWGTVLPQWHTLLREMIK